MTQPETTTAPSGATPAGAPRVVQSDDDRSLAGLVTEMSSELSTLVRKELQLAVTELREEGLRARDLAQQTANEATAAVREDLQLAQDELKQEAKKAGIGAALLVAAGVVGLVTFLLLAWTIAWAINEVTWEWVGFLVTAILFGIVAAVLALSGRNKLQQVNPKPERAIEAAKRDVETIKNSSRERAQSVSPKPQKTIETVKDDVQTIREAT